jgi:hypothetical protein
MANRRIVSHRVMLEKCLANPSLVDPCVRGPFEKMRLRLNAGGKLAENEPRWIEWVDEELKKNSSAGGRSTEK